MAQVCLELDVYNKLDTEQVRLLGFLSPLLIHQVITTTTKTTKGTKKKLEKNECVRNYLWRFAFGGSSMMFFLWNSPRWVNDSKDFITSYLVIPLLFGKDVVKEEG